MGFFMVENRCDCFTIDYRTELNVENDGSSMDNRFRMCSLCNADQKVTRKIRVTFFVAAARSIRLLKYLYRLIHALNKENIL